MMIYVAFNIYPKSTDKVKIDRLVQSDNIFQRSYIKREQRRIMAEKTFYKALLPIFISYNFSKNEADCQLPVWR